MIRRLDEETLIEFKAVSKRGKKTVDNTSWKIMTVEGRAKRTLSLTHLKLQKIRKWEQEYLKSQNK